MLLWLQIDDFLNRSLKTCFVTCISFRHVCSRCIKFVCLDRTLSKRKNSTRTPKCKHKAYCSFSFTLLRLLLLVPVFQLCPGPFVQPPVSSLLAGAVSRESARIIGSNCRRKTPDVWVHLQSPGEQRNVFLPAYHSAAAATLDMMRLLRHFSETGQ